jgi:hypothetical protein
MDAEYLLREELGPGLWSLSLAAAASKLAWLQLQQGRKIPPPLRKRSQGFLQEVWHRARISPSPHLPGIFSKAGPEAPEVDKDREWLGHLFLAHSLSLSNTPPAHSNQQIKQLLDSLPASGPQGADLGLATRILKDLVEKRGKTLLKPLHRQFLNRVWSYALQAGPNLSMEERLRLLQAYVPLG